MTPEATARPSPGLPFAHLNLRWNPFSRPADDDEVALAVCALAPPRRGEKVQVLGAPGRGKSTALRWLAAQTPGSVLHRVEPGDAALPAALLQAEARFVDEAHRLPRRVLANLLHAPATVVVAAAAEVARDAPGPMRTEVITGPSVAALTQMLERRLAWAARGAGPWPRFTPEAVAALHGRFGGDLRALLSHLYDVLQHLEAPIDLGPNAVL